MYSPSTQQYYESNKIQVPVGSRSSASVYGGSPCPNRLELGRVHGVSPAVAVAEYDGTFPVLLGTTQVIQIGQSIFYGILIRQSKAIDTSQGDRAIFTLADMRDRLHDVNVFAAFNMMDEDTKWYHIYPSEWQEQRKRVIQKMQPQDFKLLDNSVKLEFKSNKIKLYSAFTLLESLSQNYDFTWSASEIAYNVLMYSRPENLDWNNGKKVIEVIQDICDKSNLQFTAWGDVHIYITLRGFSDNAMLNMLINNDACNFGSYVASDGGLELSEKGRRIIITGDRNVYQAVYPALPNWNALFTLRLCLGWDIAGLLVRYKLTLLSKLKDLPSRYHDPEKWQGKPRNDMTIKAYVEEICFKVYVIDFRKPGFLAYDPDDRDPQGNSKLKLWNFKTTSKLAPYTYNNGQPPFIGSYNSKHPVAKNLVSDSEHQFHCFGSHRKMHVKGRANPIIIDHGNFAPLEDGVSLDCETVIDKTTSEEKFRVRVIFSEMRFQVDLFPGNQLGQGKADELTPIEFADQRSFFQEHRPDSIAVKIALEKEIYTYRKGENPEQSNVPRIREQRHGVDNLNKSFIFTAYYDAAFSDELLSLQAVDYEEIVKQLKKPTYFEVPLLSPYYQDSNLLNSTVRADEIADRAANQYLFHQMISASGSITFDDEAGFMCDGLIDTVSVTGNPETGIQEVVNLTTEVNDVNAPPVVGLNVTSKFKDIKQLIANQEAKHAVDLLRKWKDGQQNKMGLVDINQNPADWIDQSNTFGARGSVLAEFPHNTFAADGGDDRNGSQLTPEEIYVGEVMLGRLVIPNNELEFAQIKGQLGLLGDGQTGVSDDDLIELLGDEFEEFLS